MQANTNIIPIPNWSALHICNFLLCISQPGARKYVRSSRITPVRTETNHSFIFFSNVMIVVTLVSKSF